MLFLGITARPDQLCYARKRPKDPCILVEWHKGSEKMLAMALDNTGNRVAWTLIEHLRAQLKQMDQGIAVTTSHQQVTPGRRGWGDA